MRTGTKWRSVSRRRAIVGLICFPLQVVDDSYCSGVVMRLSELKTAVHDKIYGPSE
jgi:hypothetical protein